MVRQEISAGQKRVVEWLSKKDNPGLAESFINYASDNASLRTESFKIIDAARLFTAEQVPGKRYSEGVIASVHRTYFRHVYKNNKFNFYETAGSNWEIDDLGRVVPTVYAYNDYDQLLRICFEKDRKNKNQKPQELINLEFTNSRGSLYANYDADGELDSLSLKIGTYKTQTKEHNGIIIISHMSDFGLKKTSLQTPAPAYSAMRGRDRDLEFSYEMDRTGEIAIKVHTRGNNTDKIIVPVRRNRKTIEGILFPPDKFISPFDAAYEDDHAWKDPDIKRITGISWSVFGQEIKDKNNIHKFTR